MCVRGGGGELELMDGMPLGIWKEYEKIKETGGELTQVWMFERSLGRRQGASEDCVKAQEIWALGGRQAEMHIIYWWQR